MTSFPWQSLLAPLVVLGAMGYLWWTVRSSRRRGGLGCASGGGACACPKPALPPHLKRR